MTPARPERNRPSPRRRSFFALVWPVGLLLALAAAWSGYWYAGSLAAREAFERWQQRQGDAGRQFTCAEQSFGGYPFRFEMYCTGPRLQAGPQEGSVAVHAKAMRTVSMAYAPGKVIAEFDAPMYVELEDGSAVEAGWESARMSMRVTADAQLRAKITRADLAVEAPLVNLISGPGRTFAAYTARAFQAHTRETEVTGRYDTALSAVAPELRFADGSVHRAERVDVVAAVSAVQSLRRGTWRQRLAAWRDAGGQLDLAALRLELPQALAVADGACAWMRWDGRKARST